MLKTTLPASLPSEKAHELTWGDQVIFCLAQSPPLDTKKIPWSQMLFLLDTSTTPSSVKGLHSCNSQHGHKATQDKETFLSWGKFTVLWIHKAEKAVVLSQSRFDSAGLTVANTVQTASVYFLQQSGCDSDAQCPLSEEERIISV